MSPTNFLELGMRLQQENNWWTPCYIYLFLRECLLLVHYQNGSPLINWLKTLAEFSRGYKHILMPFSLLSYVELVLMGTQESLLFIYLFILFITNVKGAHTHVDLWFGWRGLRLWGEVSEINVSFPSSVHWGRRGKGERVSFWPLPPNLLPFPL